MKASEIGTKFNPCIKQLMDEGFAPCMTELTGSYSGVHGNQMVFAKGNERAVLWMTDERGEYYEDKGIALHFAKFEVEPGETADRRHNWPDDWAANEVWGLVLYKVGEGWYSEDKAEADTAKAIRHERWANAPERPWGSRRVEVTDGILAVARKLKGFKTIKRENLEVKRSNSRARWTFINKSSRNQVTVG